MKFLKPFLTLSILFFAQTSFAKVYDCTVYSSDFTNGEFTYTVKVKKRRSPKLLHKFTGEWMKCEIDAETMVKFTCHDNFTYGLPGKNPKFLGYDATCVRTR